MQILTGYDVNIKDGCSAALGTFDGLHLGHVAVIKNALAAAERLEVGCTVISVRRSVSDELMTLKSFEESLTKLGVDTLILLDLEDIKDTSAEDFVDDFLFSKLKVRHMTCGFNCRFGRGAKGTADFLKEKCRAFGAEFTAVSPVEYDGCVVSSSAIRQAIKSGDIRLANGMLGRAFSFDFPVVSGQHLGRKLMAPTINQPLPPGFILPRFGVYASRAKLGGCIYCAVTNIGVRPTVSDENIPRAESYILNFSGNLYGEAVEVELFDFLRDEKKFATLGELEAAIAYDAERSRSIFESETKG